MTTKLYLHFPQTNLRREIEPKAEETIVGRTSACDVDLTRYMTGSLKTVSRQHFKVTYGKGEGFILVDISHNGTQINDVGMARGERRILRHGDTLKLANDNSLIIRVTIEDDPDITETIDEPTSVFPASPQPEPEFGLHFDSTNAQFVVENIPIPHEHLTRLETILLKYMYDNLGRICTFDDIATHVWDDPGWAPGNNTISRAVGNLRKKLEEVLPGAGDYIQNIRGQGYILTVDKAP